MKIILFIVCFAIRETISARVERSYGGEQISIYDARYFVSIKKENEYQCCGALITWKHVLTIASCVVDENCELQSNLRVESGTNTKITSNSMRHQIKDSAVHRRFRMENRNPYYDISVLTLSAQVPMNSEHAPIYCPFVPPIDSAEASLITFGRTQKKYDSFYLHRLPVVISFPDQSTSLQAADNPEYSRSIFNQYSSNVF